MAVLKEWTHNVSDIPAGGLKCERKASSGDCEDIAKALKILALESLLANYQMHALPGGGYRLSGGIQASVIQACIATLEPLPAQVNEDFTSEFWPEPKDVDDEGDRAVLDGADIEPLQNGVIDAGRIIFEALSAALDPYPRKQGAEFDWHDPASQNPEKISPFAVLAKLKDKS